MPKRNHTPFFDQPRSRKKLDYIRIKNRVQAHAPVLGGEFYSNHLIHGHNGWLDFYFLSTYGRYFYNATARTAGYVIKESAYEQAFDRSEQIKPYKVRFRRHDGPGFVMDSSESEAPELFDGLTRHEWVTRERRRILEAEPFEVHETIDKDYGYRFGVGLDAVLDVPGLSIEEINRFIERFRDLGEPEHYRRPHPVAYDPASLSEDAHLESNELLID
ncbi:hypothetical protein [Thioalkalivibrio thiocyanodenitrificans]|uniref:hypothetical protein n=1 Tax=Thioalkalivibrio thiocyanodenitrificans TaxID=243063 RepID=UPI000369C08B|nr:hypothetical protein [Thioalkalivibrio thiocyanodenitrificans]